MTDNKKTTLKILDFVNCKFESLDPFVRRQIVEKLKFFVPYARHTPSFRIGRWDGKVGFATAGGATYINLLDRVLDIVYDAGYEIEIDDLRPHYKFEFPEIDESYLADRTWPKGHAMAGEPILLRDYQVSAINTFFKHQQSIQELSTGAGKTLTSAALSLAVEKYGRTIVIVPSKSLVLQTEEDYRLIGLDVGVFYGDRKEWNHKHTICTWQSLAVFAKKTRRDEVDIPIDEFIKDVICIQIDECHSAAAALLKDLLTGIFAKVPLRFAFTGTVPREEIQALSLLSAIGPVVGAVKASDLQEKGVLAALDIKIIQTNDSHVNFCDYHSEHAWLTTNQDRLKWIAELAKTNVKEIGGNMIILVNNVETGKILEDFIDGSTFVYGSTKLGTRTEEYKSFGDAEGKIMIATYGVASTGINIVRLHSAIFIEAGRSHVRCIQSAGRLLRKGFDKEAAIIIDVCSSLKYSKKHLTVRKSYYNDAGYKNTTTKVDYR